MSTLFYQALFVPESSETFEQDLADEGAFDWEPRGLEGEASLYLECAITNWPVAALLNELVAPTWSEEIECALPSGLDELRVFLLRSESVAGTLALHENVHGTPKRLATRLAAVVADAGWPVDHQDMKRVEALLRSTLASPPCDSDDVAAALATAWLHRLEALRHAASREAPLACLLWH